MRKIRRLFLQFCYNKNHNNTGYYNFIAGFSFHLLSSGRSYFKPRTRENNRNAT